MSETMLLEIPAGEQRRRIELKDGMYRLRRGSFEAWCMVDIDVRDLRLFKPVIKRVDLLDTGEIVERPMVRVVSESNFHWADQKTGTLYCPKTGRCRSSELLSILPEDL